MAGGRPTKYKPEYVDEVLDFIGEQGKSVAQLARHFRVAKSTIYEWAANHKEFSDAFMRAKDWAEAIWEDQYIEMMRDRDSNPQLVKLYFANRFKWSDKAEDDSAKEKPEPLEIKFSVAKPVDDIEITRGES